MAGPKKLTGKIICVATIQVKPGKADLFQQLMVKVRAHAESNAEPGTLTYRTTRSELDENQFVIFEEYMLPGGIEMHSTSAPFKALAESGAVAKLDIQFYNEFQ